MASGIATLGLSVSGNYESPTASMIITSQGFNPMTLTGTVSQTEMVGTIGWLGLRQSGHHAEASVENQRSLTLDWFAP